MVSTDEVYAVLKYDAWLSGREIREAIAKDRGAPDPLNAQGILEFVATEIRYPSIGSIYVRLSDLVREGFAERRESTLPVEEQEELGIESIPEYRKNRHKIRRKEKRGFEGNLVSGLVPVQ